MNGMHTLRNAKQQPVKLTYLDTRDPGTVTMQVADHYRPGVVVEHRMTIGEAAQLSEQLREAVRMSGYDMVARKRGA